MLFPGQSRYHGIQTIGLLNALKTGDPTMDTMLAVFLPIILTKFVEYLSRRHGDNHETWFSRLNFLSKRMYRRTISYTERPPGSATLHDHNRPVDDDSYNSFLIKAIKLYMHEHCKFDPRDLDLELTDALNSNQSKKLEAKSSQKRHMPRMRQTNRGLHQTSIESSGSSTFAMLEKCSIIQKPVQNKWHEIGKFDGKPVQLLITEAANGGKPRKPATFADAGGSEEEGNSRSIEVRLKSEGLSSVDTFVGEAYEWYLSQLAKEQSDERYFFDLKGFEGRGSHRYPVFGKYTLSDEKTFKSLFSRKCHELLGLIDQFQSKSGKYAVEGYPHKVGLLLHGEPGTGKTSLIKAVAHYTKRHIVNVPLSRIETNNELMTLFFNQRYTAAGQNANQTPKMDFDQVIFVFEDIDAATDVVKRREYTTGDGERTKRKDIVIAAQPHVPRILATTSASASASSRQTGGATTTQSAFQSDDQLNLMGLLNVLDGVVDTPGRMIIMTSNHPEVLDPALIRPGRIDKILELTHLESPDVVAMISHYYETELSPKDQTRVHCAIHGDGETSEYLKLIPANVEQRVMEEETKESMLKWLETERHDLDTKTSQPRDLRMKACRSTVTEGTDDLSTSEESNSEQN